MFWKHDRVVQNGRHLQICREECIFWWRSWKVFAVMVLVKIPFLDDISWGMFLIPWLIVVLYHTFECSGSSEENWPMGKPGDGTKNQSLLFFSVWSPGRVFKEGSDTWCYPSGQYRRFGKCGLFLLSKETRNLHWEDDAPSEFHLRDAL